MYRTAMCSAALCADWVVGASQGATQALQRVDGEDRYVKHDEVALVPSCVSLHDVPAPYPDDVPDRRA